MQSAFALSTSGKYVCAGLICFSLIWYLTRSRKRSPTRSTQFGSFLIQDVLDATHQPSNFDRFLRDADIPSKVTEKTIQNEFVPIDKICVPILYGTEFGFSKEIAEALSERIKTTTKFW